MKYMLSQILHNYLTIPATYISSTNNTPQRDLSTLLIFNIEMPNGRIQQLDTMIGTIQQQMRIFPRNGNLQ